MRVLRLLLVLPLGSALLAEAPATRSFRQWLGGQEVGGARTESFQEASARVVRVTEWLTLSRLGQGIRQEVRQTARKAADGSLTFTWRLQLSAEPLEGRAEWSPREPGVLWVRPNQGAATRQQVPEGALLWPEDLDAQLAQAARSGRKLVATTFSFPLQQWSTLSLEPQGPAPLPGFPDAVRFLGEERQGTSATRTEVWFSPTAGELRHRADLGGLAMISQRAELPAPAPSGTEGPGFFERTLQRLPPHPFLPWLDEVVLRTEGTLPSLPEDDQQQRMADGRWRLRRAQPPRGPAASEPPAAPAPAGDRYLAATQLVAHQDPVFDGLIRRLGPVQSLSRWELSRRVTRFVFEWIADKDFSVGFASATEVARHAKGDCTEHGVLAVALLRKLGVPARGVTGWVALGEVMGLHFWVEVQVGGRWIPVDPTFDQAPASALRIKVGDTDLADLGSLGWEGAAQALSGLAWIPERTSRGAWGADLGVSGDRVDGPGGLQLRLPGGRWSVAGGGLHLSQGGRGPWSVQAVVRPPEGRLRTARRLAGASSRRQGWWHPDQRALWVEWPGDRWLELGGVAEDEAFALLDQLLAAPTATP